MSHSKKIEIITPENISLQLELASVADRTAAFLLDVMILFLLSSLFLGFLFVTQLILFAPLLVTSVAIIVLFILWNGYFIFFELKSGRSPGKKSHRFKVIQEDGTALSVGSIYVRNLLREIEVWIPLRMVFIASMASSLSQIWFVVAFSWVFIGVLFPYFDKKNRRLGDIVAGTVVVVMPDFMLEKELAEESLSKEKEEQQTDTISFTPEMLDIYGKKELEALEDILRKHKTMQYDSQKKLILDVAKKIQKKIGYEKEVPSRQALLFLEKFYQAQRKCLEQKLIHGKSLTRKKWK
ncbi:MAG: RDD family protein [Candidatus Brocadiae bacterium]|nr:RDD family protein [Candidatus Brocadiia bacterium]